jgi:RNA-directed DNA polymerase
VWDLTSGRAAREPFQLDHTLNWSPSAIRDWFPLYVRVDWMDERDGVPVRFADDLVVMCWSRSQVEAALARLTAMLADLGLEPKAAKTRIVRLDEGGGGVDFLGFQHRLVRSRGLNGKPRVLFLARWPADRAVQHARDRIRELTGRRRLLPPEVIAHDVNMFLRGWAGYFNGHSARRLSSIRQYADAASAVHQKEAPPQPRVRVAGHDQLIARRPRPDQPVRNHGRIQGREALAGEAECRR